MVVSSGMVALPAAGCHCNNNSFLILKRVLKEDKELVLSVLKRHLLVIRLSLRSEQMCEILKIVC